MTGQEPSINLFRVLSTLKAMTQEINAGCETGAHRLHLDHFHVAYSSSRVWLIVRFTIPFCPAVLHIGLCSVAC